MRLTFDYSPPSAVASAEGEPRWPVGTAASPYHVNRDKSREHPKHAP